MESPAEGQTVVRWCVAGRGFELQGAGREGGALPPSEALAASLSTGKSDSDSPPHPHPREAFFP